MVGQRWAARMERTRGKVTDCEGEAGLAEEETKDSKVAVKYCRGCHGERNSKSHRRVSLESAARVSKPAALLPL